VTNAPKLASEGAHRAAPPPHPEVIPAIDLLDGKAVRLRKGRYEDVTVYPEEPESLAARWSEHVGRLHVVDLEGARRGRAVQSDTVARVLRAFRGSVQVGGGVRSRESIDAYFELGAARVVLGTVALKDPELVARAAEAYPNRIIVAVDGTNGFVSSEGWLEHSERRSADVVRDFSGYQLAAILYTDVERDGTEVGPNVEATAQLASETSAHVIASGGVGTLEHLRALGAAARGVEGPGAIVGAIVGRALHEKRFTLEAAVAALGSSGG
jgi:phosphoribosylformimino-5-aminoimidazole carboxamide ribotide isomerase